MGTTPVDGRPRSQLASNRKGVSTVALFLFLFLIQVFLSHLLSSYAMCGYALKFLRNVWVRIKIFTQCVGTH